MARSGDNGTFRFAYHHQPPWRARRSRSQQSVRGRQDGATGTFHRGGRLLRRSAKAVDHPWSELRRPFALSTAAGAHLYWLRVGGDRRRRSMRSAAERALRPVHCNRRNNADVFVDSGGLYWDSAGTGKLYETTRRCRDPFSRLGRRLPHRFGRNNLYCWEPQRTTAGDTEDDLRDGRAKATSTSFRLGTPAIPHALCFNIVIGSGNTRVRTFRHFHPVGDDQRSVEGGCLCDYLPRSAGATAQKQSARTVAQGTFGQPDCNRCIPDVPLDVIEQH